MDAKSLAKSKRAHSLHNQSKRPHPNQKPKAPTTSATSSSSDANANKPSTKHSREKSRQSKLPSNWDRYEDEFGSGSEDASIAARTDVVVPKSKGADFGYLISEAQTQLESKWSGNSDGFASFDDVLPDFIQGVSSMLSVRGNNILSWIGDDNFIVDDNSTRGYEASYLSMDLHALAAQLEKLDVSKRLFVEADILPPELLADESKGTISPETEEAETYASEVAERPMDEFAFLGHADDRKIIDDSCNISRSTAYPHQGTGAVDHVNEALHCTTTINDTSVPIFRYQGDRLTDTIKDDYKQLEQNDHGIGDSVSVADLTKTSTFEAMAAESELDMLLNSFEETKLVDSSDMSKKSSSKVVVASLSETFPSVYASKLPTQSKGFPLNINLDDTIDDLLNEASHLKNQKVGAILAQEAAVKSHVPAASSHSSTKVLDDFDSWLDTI